uniref:Uncharacterized protein n=1 Tax=Ditylenchus dipsaci TaxID=166011 RepID=A0A915EBJ9_9BILA
MRYISFPTGSSKVILRIDGCCLVLESRGTKAHYILHGQAIKDPKSVDIATRNKNKNEEFLKLTVAMIRASNDLPSKNQAENDRCDPQAFSQCWVQG